MTEAMVFLRKALKKAVAAHIGTGGNGGKLGRRFKGRQRGKDEEHICFFCRRHVLLLKRHVPLPKNKQLLK